MKVIPLFTSAHSFKSILHFDKDETGTRGGNIKKICIENNIKKLFLVEDNMAGFLDAYNHCGDKVQLIFGLRVRLTNEKPNKKEIENYAKYIIFAKNGAGYKSLIKIFSKAATEGFCAEKPTISFSQIKEMWSEDLVLAVPFYDSFIFKNAFYFSNCIPDFHFTKPIFFIESNGLYFDEHIRGKVKSYCSSFDYDAIESQTIYYENRKDFLAWQTYRCIQNRSSLEVPNFEHCSSDEFCLEVWKEKVKVDE